MYYGQKPLFPPMGHECEPGACVRVPLFCDDGCCCAPAGKYCRKVLLENPCRPGECAEVLLGVDECGNLTVCVHRDTRWACGCPPACDPCPPPRRTRKVRC